ncbi:AraC family transcriptional regulator, partial [Mycobacterium sp. ITM-2017-0098]
PAMHITHEWGEGNARHGFSLPNTLVHGVVERVFRTTISERGAVVGARFWPGGFTARFGGDASTMTGRVLPVEEGLFGVPVRLDDD